MNNLEPYYTFLYPLLRVNTLSTHSTCGKWMGLTPDLHLSRSYYLVFHRNLRWDISLYYLWNLSISLTFIAFICSHSEYLLTYVECLWQRYICTQIFQNRTMWICYNIYRQPRSEGVSIRCRPAYWHLMVAIEAGNTYPVEMHSCYLYLWYFTVH